MDPDTLTTDAAHARFSPSSADGWGICAAYIQVNEQYEDEESEFAAEGTFAHEISDECLASDKDPYDFIGVTRRIGQFTFTFDEEMADALMPGIQQIRDFGGKFYGEHKVNISDVIGIPGQFGTLDRGVVLPELIVISDLKFGRGVPVSPIRNKQLALYALGFYENVARHLTKATTFKIIIDQPRCTNGGGEWTTTLEELYQIRDELRVAAQLALQPNPPRTASEKGCLWCMAQRTGECSTYDEFILDALDAKFDDLDEPEIKLADELTPERRARLIRQSKQIEKWLETQHARHLQDILHGFPGGGLKAVLGRKNPDTYEDREFAQGYYESIYGDKVITKKLITPKQLLKVIGSDEAESAGMFIKTGERKPILVPEEDDRPPIVSVDLKFDAIDDETE